MSARVVGFACSLLVVVTLAAPAWSSALPPGLPPGLPPITEIPSAPDLRPLYYAVAQAPDGAVFSGGIAGIVRYDGRRYTHLPMPNGRLVRSLAHDGKDRLYVGGYGQLGYVETNVHGELEFIDLTPPPEDIPEARNLADIWELLITPDGVIFRALFHVFRYRPDSGEIDVWHHPQRFGTVVHHQGQTLLQFRTVGLKRLRGNDFEPVPGGELLTSQLHQLLPLADGGLLTLARDGLWQRFDQGRLEPVPVPPSLPPSSSFQRALVLDDHTIILAGSDGHLHSFDPATSDHRQYPVASTWISDLARAADGNLLAQTDQATLHVIWPAPWTRIGPNTGLTGTIYGMRPWHGYWLALTSAGARRTIERGAGRIEFEEIDWPPMETWDWWDFEPERALLAGSYDLFEVGDFDSVEAVSRDLYPRLIQPSRFQPDRVHIGTELGLALLERVDGQWQVRFKQPDFTGLVNSIIELDSHRLLLAITGTGLVEARYNDQYTELEQWRLVPVDDSSPLVDESRLLRMNDGRIIASMATGLYRWDGSGFEPTDLDGLSGHRRDGGVYTLVEEPDGDLWAYTYNHLLRRQADAGWRTENIDNLAPGEITSLSVNPGQPVLLGGKASVLKFNRAVAAIDRPSPPLRLRSASILSAQGQQRLLPLDGRPIELPHDTVSVVFEFALPYLQRRELIRYRNRLLGFEEAFSNWGTTTRITFSNLHPGLKRFEAQARDPEGRISAIEPLQFTILPPWYRTTWAWLAWVVLGLALLTMLVLAIVRARVIRLDVERRRLAHMVDRRTRELAAANRKLSKMAKVDGLTGVANRRRLDEFLDESWARCGERGCRLAIILIDVDHFKQFNDTRGHQAGDDALREVADLLVGSLRRSEDVVARYGGEEFMVVLPTASVKTARTVAEDMRRRIEESPIGVTVSLGVAAMQPQPKMTTRDLIRRVDQALYRAKRGGRNRVEVFMNEAD